MGIVRIMLAMLSLAVAAWGQAQEADENLVVLGKLGQATKASTIYARQTTASRAYYRVNAYDYLVVLPSNSKDWFKVLLQNGNYGFVRSFAVARLPYDVTCSAEAMRGARGSTASRSRSIRQVGSGAGAQVAGNSQYYIGAPYKWGGNDPNSGIDCSAFVKMLYGQIGVDLPRTAAEQALVGQEITMLEDLRAGDRLYFWSRSRGKIGHTGVYLGNGYFTHSSSSNGGVVTSYLGAAEWRNKLVAARRGG